MFLKKDYKLYIEHMQRYFPLSDANSATPDKARETTPPHNEEVSEKEDGCSSTSKTPPLIKSVTVPVYSVTPKEEKMETKAEGKECETVDPTDKNKGSVNEGCGHVSEKDMVPIETEKVANESSTNAEVEEISENMTKSHKD